MSNVIERDADSHTVCSISVSSWLENNRPVDSGVPLAPPVSEELSVDAKFEEALVEPVAHFRMAVSIDCFEQRKVAVNQMSLRHGLWVDECFGDAFTDQIQL